MLHIHSNLVLMHQLFLYIELVIFLSFEIIIAHLVNQTRCIYHMYYFKIFIRPFFFHVVVWIGLAKELITIVSKGVKIKKFGGVEVMSHTYSNADS